MYKTVKELRKNIVPSSIEKLTTELESYQIIYKLAHTLGGSDTTKEECLAAWRKRAKRREIRYY